MMRHLMGRLMTYIHLIYNCHTCTFKFSTASSKLLQKVLGQICVLILLLSYSYSELSFMYALPGCRLFEI